MVLAGQLSVLEDAELESELEAILKNIASTSTAPEVSSIINVISDESSTAGLPLTADSSDLKEYSVVLPEVPNTPILQLPSQIEIKGERIAIPS